jgi:2,4-dienoyl-CoA reductase-like NADH-dependent reductase (Old Yellow Enzyme family)
MVPSPLAADYYGQRASAGLLITEASQVSQQGQGYQDTPGIYSKEQVAGWRKVTDRVHELGGRIFIQIWHVGRVSHDSLQPGGGKPVAPSAIRAKGKTFVNNSFVDISEPRALELSEIPGIIEDFKRGTDNALAAGFDGVEIHGAHGYLIHEFLSPIANRRDDQWGGSFDNRTRFLTEIVRAIRAVWPDRLPLAVRLSTTDWLGAEGWDVEDSIALARRLGREGVDVIDCSSGGIAPRVAIDAGPGYQVANAARIRIEAPIATAAVGVITSAAQAEHILRSGQADMVLLARAILRDPYFALHAAAELGADVAWPPQYLRAQPPRR